MSHAGEYCGQEDEELVKGFSIINRGIRCHRGRGKQRKRNIIGGLQGCIASQKNPRQGPGRRRKHRLLPREGRRGKRSRRDTAGLSGKSCQRFEKRKLGNSQRRMGKNAKSVFGASSWTRVVMGKRRYDKDATKTNRGKGGKS